MPRGNPARLCSIAISTQVAQALKEFVLRLSHIIAAVTIAASAGMAAAQAGDAPVASDHAVDTVSPGDFSPAGKAYDVDFGSQKFRLEFLSDKALKFTSPDGKNAATVDVTVTRIRPQVFMVYWSRRAGQHVVHIEDFENGVAYSNIFLPDGSAQRLKDTLKLVH